MENHIYNLGTFETIEELTHRIKKPITGDFAYILSNKSVYAWLGDKRKWTFVFRNEIDKLSKTLKDELL